MDLEALLASLTDPNIRSDDWVRLNEFSDLMSSLRASEKLIELTQKDVGMWKWVVLSLHSAVQGSAVCMLTRSDGSGALKDHIEKRVWALYGANKNTLEHAEEFNNIFSKDEVASLPVLLRRMGYDFPRDDVPPAKALNETLHYLVKLHNWRSLFTHFPPLDWSAPEADFVDMARTVVGFIRELLSSDNWNRRPLITEDELFPLLDRIDAMLADRIQDRLNSSPSAGDQQR